MRVGCLLQIPEYKAGDQPPPGYLEWHEWAKTQHKAGLRQSRCPKCGKWRYSQEPMCLSFCGFNGYKALPAPVGKL